MIYADLSDQQLSLLLEYSAKIGHYDGGLVYSAALRLRATTEGELRDDKYLALYKELGGRKISLIKQYREDIPGCTLKKARVYVDDLLERNRDVVIRYGTES